MNICVKKLTDIELMRMACEMTFRGKSNVSLFKMYKAEHSPIRTQIFWVEMLDIPTFASVHFTRHKIGVEHFVLTNREDRGGDKDADRNTPVNHGMIVNAQALINMSRVRLCNKAHVKVREIMNNIRDEVAKVDHDLAEHMVKNCMYRGECPELIPCYVHTKKKEQDVIDVFLSRRVYTTHKQIARKIRRSPFRNRRNRRNAA